MTITLASINNFAELAKKHPLLLNVGAFHLLKDILQKAPSKGCNCSAKSNLAQYRPQFEAALSMLSPGDQSRLKGILSADQICYYVKNTQGQLKKHCF